MKKRLMVWEFAFGLVFMGLSIAYAADANSGKEMYLQYCSSDGRRKLRAHGDPVMPVWGESFSAEVTDPKSSEVKVAAKEKAIAEYVATLQRQFCRRNHGLLIRSCGAALQSLPRLD